MPSPGRPEDEASVGCNDLIRQGAGLVTDPAELVEALYGAGDASDALWCLADLRRERARILGRERAEEKTGRARSAFMQEELFADHAKALPPDRTLWSFVLLALTGTPKTQEELLPQVAARAGRNVSRTELARTLSRLVRQGLVREQFGRYRSMLQGGSQRARLTDSTRIEFVHVL
jgi:predicted Rossmann fold nucleotide-binding protein DprA/Smf involved in DNA uptake